MSRRWPIPIDRNLGRRYSQNLLSVRTGLETEVELGGEEEPGISLMVDFEPTPSILNGRGFVHAASSRHFGYKIPRERVTN